MLNRYHSRSLSTRITAAFILIVVVGIGGFTLILYSYFQNVIEQNTRRIVDATARTNSMMISSVMQRIDTSCDALYQENTVYSAYAETAPPALIRMIIGYKPEPDNANLGQLRDDYESNLAHFNGVFADCFANGEAYSNVLFTDDSWPIHRFMPKRTSGAGAHGFSSNIRVKDQDWYQKAVALNGSPYWFSQAGSTTLQMAKLLKYRYLDNSLYISESVIGVIYVSFDITDSLQSVDITKLMPDGMMLLYNESSDIVFASKPADGIQDLLDQMDAAALNRIQTVYWHGSEHLLNTIELPLGLWMLTVIPVTNIFSATFHTVRIIIIIGALMIGLVIAFTVFISRTLFKPLQIFADRMERGNLEELVFDETRQDEIGVLHRSFNHLMAKLEESRIKELEANEQRKQHEVHALQMQINPHFLYNTLNSISCLAMLNKQDRIASLIGCLTQIMRYNINNPEKMVTIAEELSMIKQYATIQLDCYRDRVAFEYDVDKGTERLMIPKLIIQPLIENSVQYGISKRQEKVSIRLSIYIQDDDLIIEVWDSGIGADINTINRYVIGELEGKGDSLGIPNVYRRINLMYGDDASLVYSQDDEAHTVATIRIPHKLL